MGKDLDEGFYVEKNLRRSSLVLLCYVTRREGELVALFAGSNSEDEVRYLPIREGVGLDRSVGLDPTLLESIDPFQYLKEYNEHLVKFIAGRITISQLEQAANRI